MGPQAPVSRSSQQGIALIVVLWTLVLLTAVAGSVTFTQRTEIDLNKTLIEQTRGRQLARAGVHYAVYMLRLNDEGKAWQIDGRPYRLRFDDHELVIQVFEEQGLIDLNKAGDPLLAKAFSSVGLGAAQVEAVLDAVRDWQDADDVHRLRGAEARDYQAAGYPYGPANTEFRDPAELRLVYGVTSETYQRVRDLFTVDSPKSDVNLMAAPPQVRALLADALTGSGPADAVRLKRSSRPAILGAGAGGFVGGLARVNVSGLRVRVEVDLGAGGRYVTAATVVLDNQAPSGFHITKWHEAGVNFPHHEAEDIQSG
jgi:general secretion pathway protein K